MQNIPVEDMYFTDDTELRDFKGIERFVPLYLAEGGLVKMQINSFNSFIDKNMKEIIMAHKDHYLSDGRLFIQYRDIYVGYPDISDGIGTRREIFPQECRLRDLTYAANIYVDITYQRGNRDDYVKKDRVLIGRLPIMLRTSHCNIVRKTRSPEVSDSDGDDQDNQDDKKGENVDDRHKNIYDDKDFNDIHECRLDPGGYFVIKGAERVLMIQEQTARNRILVEVDGADMTATVMSCTSQRKSKTSIFLKRDIFYMRHNSFSENVPVYILIKALGVETDQEALSLIGLTSEACTLMAPSLHHCHEVAQIHTSRAARKYLEDKILLTGYEYGIRDLSKGEIVDRLLADVVLPHIETDGRNLRDKGIYFCVMIYRFITAKMDPKTADSREHYGNKRVELASSLLSLLFEDLFQTFNSDLKKIHERSSKKKDFDLANYISPRYITDRMELALLTGNWVIKRFKMDRPGMTQVLNRNCYLATITHITRIVSQFEKSRKASGPRSIHGTSIYLICPCDTPEGESCGLVKNFALLSDVSVEIDEEPLRKALLDFGTVEVDFLAGDQLTSPCNFIVFLNGRILGMTTDGKRLVADIRKLRRMGCLHYYNSIGLDERRHFVIASCDRGRIILPLFRVEKQKCLFTPELEAEFATKVVPFDWMIKRGILEYCDSNELENVVLASNRETITEHTTHMEVVDFAQIGMCASAIPFANHDPAPRLTYQCAMGKQSQGVIAENHHYRFDSVIYNLIYPQKPLVKTKVMDMALFNSLPAGQNALVAIMSYSGYDMEDALIFNKASIERGLGRSSVYKKEVSYFDPSLTASENAIGPDTKSSRFTVLEEDGLPQIGARVKNGQSLFVRRALTEDGGNIPKDTLHYRGVDDCYVDRVMLTSNDREKSIVKVKYRIDRIPEIGDKFSSRHGQKGVIGNIVPQEDLPFTESGMIPDIIMNPHGFPSRMTVGKLIEVLCGKAAAVKGTHIDATIFQGGDKAKYAEAILKEYGFNQMGDDIVYNGITGDPLQCTIYNGIVYYQKLRHMVGDKIHARSTGPVIKLTRQPTEGRNREGGLRIGEMERDCLIAYGASNLIHERLVTSSDSFMAHICAHCGMLATSEWCQYCRDGARVYRVNMPYAFKLLIQELTGMNIVPRFQLETLM